MPVYSIIKKERNRWWKITIRRRRGSIIGWCWASNEEKWLYVWYMWYIYKWYILHIIYTWVCVCTHIYVIFPKGIQPCNMKSWDICWRYKIQEMYIGQWRPSPLHLGTWDLTQFSQLPSAAQLYCPESHWWSEISSLSKVILVLEKAWCYRTPNVGFSRAGSPGWFDVLPKNSA